MKRSNGAVLITAYAAAGLALPVSAHHSTAMFDHDKCVQMQGTLRKLSMNYPHAWVWLSVTDKAGKETIWALESTDPATLRAKGWQRSDSKPGDQMRVAVHPVRDGRAIGSVTEVRLADGRVIAGGSRSTCKLMSK